MEQQRPLLFIALAVILFMIWQAWMRDQAALKPPAPTPAAPAAGAAKTPAAPAAAPDEVPQAPETPAAEAVPAGPESAAFPTRGRLVVVTDVLRAEIDTFGGDLRVADLLAYPVSVEEPDHPVRLLSETPPVVHVAQSGFTVKRKRVPGVLYEAPNHRTPWNGRTGEYRLEDGGDAITVSLTWTSPEGVRFTKFYDFRRGSYEITVRHRVDNPTASPWRGNLYGQLLRSGDDSGSQGMVYTYTGGVYYTPEEKYRKVGFDDMDEEPVTRTGATGGWVAFIQHYFLAAWIPPADVPHRLSARARRDGRYVMAITSPEAEVAPGASGEFSARLYVGPKLQRALEEVAPGLELTVDYGLLTVIAKPLFWLLDWLHRLVGNWGWAIVLLTVIIKLAFYKLSETSYRSMAKMRKLQPKMMALRERYGNDRQKMGQAMMELYKKEKVSPLGGCLPIAIQIPVFIALYWVLLESVELRQADWILWYKDLSTRDPYFVLPLIMGATMFLQQKLNPPQIDPMQQKIMMALPLVFTVFFLFFPSGLVLYWVANNILSIAQQWYITRRVLGEGQPARR